AALGAKHYPSLGSHSIHVCSPGIDILIAAPAVEALVDVFARHGPRLIQFGACAIRIDFNSRTQRAARLSPGTIKRNGPGPSPSGTPSSVSATRTSVLPIPEFSSESENVTR